MQSILDLDILIDLLIPLLWR